MPLARVVTFSGVDSGRAEEMRKEIGEGDVPEGLPATEVIILHDAAAAQSMAIVFFENDDDYRQGDAVLDAMPAADTPGRRTSVARYEVVVRRTV